MNVLIVEGTASCFCWIPALTFLLFGREFCQYHNTLMNFQTNSNKTYSKVLRSKKSTTRFKKLTENMLYTIARLHKIDIFGLPLMCMVLNLYVSLGTNNSSLFVYFNLEPVLHHSGVSHVVWDRQNRKSC